jgi:hypothetical protein
MAGAVNTIGQSKRGGGDRSSKAAAELKECSDSAQAARAEDKKQDTSN